MTEWGVSQDDVLNAARAGRLFVQWVPLIEGIEVMADAARLDGVRVPVTGTTAEAIAREWECELPTPATCDLRHWAAVEHGVVIPRPPTQDYRTMWTAEAIHAYNEALDAAGAPPAVTTELARIVSDAGKVWAMTTVLRQRRAAGEDLACNYGFFTTQARTPRGELGPKPSVTNRWNVWQEPGYRHNQSQWDYSQTLQLVRVASGYEQPSVDGLTNRETPGVVPVAPPAQPSPPPVAPPDASADVFDTVAALGIALGAAALAFPRQFRRLLR